MHIFEKYLFLAVWWPSDGNIKQFCWFSLTLELETQAAGLDLHWVISALCVINCIAEGNNTFPYNSLYRQLCT